MTSHTFIINLTFRTTDLGVDADFILTFDNGAIPGIYKDYYPTAWKVTTFRKKGEYFLPVTYRSQFAFTKPIVSGGVIQPHSPFIAIDNEQITTLIKDDGVYSFTQSVDGPTGCENGVQASEDIGIGFVKSLDSCQWADTVQVWVDVPSESFLPAEFIMILRGYVATGYKEGEVVRRPILAPVLFEQNLARLEEDTVWILEYDESLGRFSITQAREADDPVVDTACSL